MVHAYTQKIALQTLVEDFQFTEMKKSNAQIQFRIICYLRPLTSYKTYD